jgi:hypothetical protein
MRARGIAATVLALGLFLGGPAPGIAQDQATPVSVGGADALPNAQPGECYSKVLIPAEYKTETEQVVTRDAYEKIQIIPAEYQATTEKVMIKQAAEELIPVEPVFETVKERVETQPARRLWRVGKNRESKQADPSLVSGAQALGLPVSAEVGQCYAEYYQPTKYKTQTEKVVVREAHQGIETVPPKYEMVDEKVIISDASFKLVEVPPVYETVTEKVLEAPAYTTWKTGRGPVERIDNSTGDIMCLVEVPAKYKTVEKRVLKSPATTQKIEIPAKYKMQKVRRLVSAAQFRNTEVPATFKTVTKRTLVSEAKTVWQPVGQQGPGKHTGRKLCLHEVPAKHEVITKKVLKAPATTRKIEIPAEHKMQQVRKLVSPAQEKRVQVPAKVATFTRRVKVADAKLEWRPVLCETNMSKDLNLQIQRALQGHGFNPGEIDGVLGRQTMVAVGEFQKKEGLPRGGLTLRTLTELGVNPGSALPSSNVRTKNQQR